MSGQLSEWGEIELFRQFQQGHAAAFEEIYRRFSAVLYQHAFKMLENEADAQDIIQDVFANLWTKRAELNIPDSPAAYLYVSTRNKVLNVISGKRSYQHHLDHLKQFISETDSSTIEQLNERELLLCIEKEVQQLPAKMREVFELSRKATLSHREIAQQLELSPETVKKQVSNAVRILKHKLVHFIFFLF